MATSIHALFDDMIRDWAALRWPAADLQASAPAFRAAVGDDQLDFDRWLHAEEVPGWCWDPVHPPRLAGPVMLYRPSAWDRVRTHDRTAQLAERDRIRQSIWIGTLEGWARDLDRFLGTTEILAFDYRLLGTGESRWVCATATGPAWWIWLFHARGGELALIKGDADETVTLDRQLVSLVNARPFDAS